MKCWMISCLRPSNRSSSDASPPGPANWYGLSIRTIGSRRRSAFSAS
jgi:hypothetical protein